MKVKTGQILAAFQSGALTRLANTALPMKTALKLREILKSCEAAMKDYDDKRIDLCKEYSPEVNAETGNYDIPPEKRAEFQPKADALLHAEVEIKGEPFTSAQLLSSSSFTANDLLILDWLVTA